MGKQKPKTIFLDSRELIVEMKHHPPLWDHSCDGYKGLDLADKLEHWRQVAYKCVQNVEEIFALPNGEDEAINKTRQRWKSIKDSYLRQCSLIKAGQLNKKRMYMFFEELQFLDKLYSGSGLDAMDSKEETQKTKHIAPKASTSTSTNCQNESEIEEPAEKRQKVDIGVSRNVLAKQSKEQITNLISNVICKDMLPISFVDGDGFKELISNLCPLIKRPLKKIISSRINEMHETTKNKLKSILLDTQYVSLSLDTWTSRNLQFYMSVNCHFISDEWEAQTYNLVTEVMDEYHTTNHILEKIENVVQEWGIGYKVVGIVHEENSNLKDGISESMFLKEGISCFAHSLQTIMDRAFFGVEEIQTLLMKCTKIVSHFKNSTLASENLRQQQVDYELPEHKLIHSINGNWSSTYKMLNRLAEQKQALIAIFMYEENTLNSDDWIIIEKLIKILNPFDAATIMLNSVCPTLSVIEPIVTSIFNNYISNIDSSENYIINSFKTVLASEFKKLFPFLHSNTVSTIDYATFLDLRYKNFLKNNKKRAVKLFFKNQLEEIEIIKTEPKNESKLNDSTSAFCILFPDSDNICNSDEVDLYNLEPEIPKTNCPLKWWMYNQNKYPQLANHARKYFSIPSISKPVDKAFANPATANANKLLLKPNEVDKIVFLNNNFDLTN